MQKQPIQDKSMQNTWLKSVMYAVYLTAVSMYEHYLTAVSMYAN